MQTVSISSDQTRNILRFYEKRRGPLRLIHSSVPGRMRLQMSGLNRFPELAPVLENRLAQTDQVYDVEIRPRSRSVIVKYNRSEIATLRRFNERDRISFQLAKSKEMQRVGDIQLRLRDTDIKRNKFSIEILADDKKFVKKQRQVAEPVMFYMGDSAQPYELVVTKIEKDAVSGYLARPKTQMASR